MNTGGLLLGHNGSTMEKICNTYKCTIKLCGAGSSNNPANEFNLYHSGDPQYQHYNMPLHMIISIKGTPLSAYERFYKLLNMVLCIINMVCFLRLLRYNFICLDGSVPIGWHSNSLRLF